MIVVDTSVWVDWFNGAGTAESDLLESVLRTDTVGIVPLVLTEVLQGFRSDDAFDRAHARLASLPVLALDVAGHVEAARLYRSLRRRGITVRGAGDCIIAQTCIAAGAELLARDRDFGNIAKHSALRLRAA